MVMSTKQCQASFCTGAYQTKIIGNDKESTNESSLLVEDTGILIPIMEENVAEYIMNTSIQLKEIIEDYEFEYESLPFLPASCQV